MVEGQRCLTNQPMPSSTAYLPVAEAGQPCSTVNRYGPIPPRLNERRTTLQNLDTPIRAQALLGRPYRLTVLELESMKPVRTRGVESHPAMRSPLHRRPHPNRSTAPAQRRARTHLDVLGNPCRGAKRDRTVALV